MGRATVVCYVAQELLAAPEVEDDGATCAQVGETEGRDKALALSRNTLRCY